jgi:hypothetical protein
MRRWLTILLLVMLPFQFSWGMAASYCQHETGTLASHFGHHEHKHEGAKLNASGTERSDAGGNLGALDDDCAVCHLSCVPPLAASQAVDIVRHLEAHDLAPIAEFESHISGVPQRPDCSLAV